MKPTVVFLLRLALRIFYRRIRYAGIERVPAAAPVLFVLNHPNALVDPLFVLDAVPRPVHFLAKAPLFRLPLVGRIVRAAGGLPVFRQQDGADTRDNEQTFRECHAALGRGECVAIFPEGTTHSETVLKPMKTGAARIALGAEASASFALGLQIVPVGLQYEAKETFRSAVSVWFGEPHQVTDLAGRYEMDPADAVIEETHRLGIALYDVTMNLDRQDVLDLVAATEIFTADSRSSTGESLRLQREFAAAYAALGRRIPERLARLRRSLGRHVTVLRRLGLRARDLRPGRAKSAAGLAVRALGAVPMLAVAVVGVLLEWVPYRLVEIVARRLSRTEPELTATVKVLAAVVLYPSWWALTILIGWRLGGGGAALALLVAHPAVSLLAITAIERLERLRRRLQVFRLAARHGRLDRLRRHQRAIQREMHALVEMYRQDTTGTSSA